MSLKEENFFPRGLKYLAWGLPFSKDSQHLSNCQFVFLRKGIFLQLISDTYTLQIAGPYFQEKVTWHRNMKDVGLAPISIFLTQPCGTEVSIILGEPGQYFSWPPVLIIFQTRVNNSHGADLRCLVSRWPGWLRRPRSPRSLAQTGQQAESRNLCCDLTQGNGIGNNTYFSTFQKK